MATCPTFSDPLETGSKNAEPKMHYSKINMSDIIYDIIQPQIKVICIRNMYNINQSDTNYSHCILGNTIEPKEYTAITLEVLVPEKYIK